MCFAAATWFDHALTSYQMETNSTLSKSGASVVLDVCGDLAVNFFHQIRLRHVEAIRGVNLTRLVCDKMVDVGDEDVFYLTIQEPGEDQPTRKGSQPKYALRTPPKAGRDCVWPLGHSAISDQILASEQFVLRLWLVEDPLVAEGHVICSYFISLRSLVPVDAVLSRLAKTGAESVGTMRTAFLPNTLCFSIGGTLFVPPCCIASDALCVKPVEEIGDEEVPEYPWKKWTSASWPLGIVQPSYLFSSACRLRSLGRVVREVQLDRAQVLGDLETMYAEKAVTLPLVEQIEKLRVRLNILRKAKSEKEAALGAKRREKLLIEEKISDGGWQLMSRFQDLNRDRERMRELGVPAWAEARNNLLAAQVGLGLRRREILSQLALIYPIVKIDGERWTIRGVHLPDGEDYANRDDVRLAVAFGFVAHLSELISFVVNVPLRHPVEFKGSRSSIISHLAPGMAGVGPVTIPDQSFPLYDRSKTRTKFDYAAYLMNVNVAHLRNLCGMSTPDLRKTLPNLSALINEVTPKKNVYGSKTGRESERLNSVTSPVPIGEARHPYSACNGPPFASTPKPPFDSTAVCSSKRRPLWHLSPSRSEIAASSSSPNLPNLVEASRRHHFGQFLQPPRFESHRLLVVRASGVSGSPPLHTPFKKSHSRSVSLEESKVREALGMGLRAAADCCLGIECGTEATETDSTEAPSVASDPCDSPKGKISLGSCDFDEFSSDAEEVMQMMEKVQLCEKTPGAKTATICSPRVQVELANESKVNQRQPKVNGLVPAASEATASADFPDTVRATDGFELDIPSVG